MGKINGYKPQSAICAAIWGLRGKTPLSHCRLLGFLQLETCFDFILLLINHPEKKHMSKLGRKCFRTGPWLLPQLAVPFCFLLPGGNAQTNPRVSLGPLLPKSCSVNQTRAAEEPCSSAGRNGCLGVSGSLALTFGENLVSSAYIHVEATNGPAGGSAWRAQLYWVRGVAQPGMG